MASASRKRTRRQNKLELLSKFLIPIPIGFMIPMVVRVFRDNAASPDPHFIIALPFILFFLLVPAGLFQLIVGLPTIAVLRGKSLVAHMLTGFALAIVMTVSQGFGDIASEFADSVEPSPDKFSNKWSTDDLSTIRPNLRFSAKDQIIEEQPTVEEIFRQIFAFGLPMMFGYYLVWNVFTAIPDRQHQALTEERSDANRGAIRTLRGEERKRKGKVVTRRKKRQVRRSL